MISIRSILVRIYQRAVRMVNHLKIFGNIVNLVIGTMVAVYVYHVSKTYYYSYLKPLFFHILLLNL